jgi:hypothetical protein
VDVAGFPNTQGAARLQQLGIFAAGDVFFHKACSLMFLF